ncbi:aminopeptidase P family protein [Candidatus Woesearchaeota archaeon]|jgi:Xaa-Pro aminopeptidase|nr:aminopeptidase P family protein [Candidatus Woesearchaeota archaeon]
MKSFKQELRKQKIHLALIINSTLQDPNFYYLTNVTPENAFMLISSKFSTKIYCSPLESAQLKSKSKIKAFYNLDKKTFEKMIALIRKYRIKKIGMNLSTITVNEFNGIKKRIQKQVKGIKFVDISNLLRKTRAIKTKQEIKLYKKATKITEIIWEKTLKYIKSKRSITEIQVKEFMEKEMNNLNLTSSFPTIVASGKNSSIPHYVPQKKKLSKGFCVIDFGINYKGYCTDITRTIYLGKPSQKEIDLYKLIFDTKNYAASLIKPNQFSATISKKTRKFLGEYDKYFTHGLGHGIGLEIHELPNLKVTAKEKFQPNMIFTIEPGIYIKNKLGIRLEDDYLLTNKSIIQLTKAPKNLAVINR